MIFLLLTITLVLHIHLDFVFPSHFYMQSRSGQSKNNKQQNSCRSQ